MAHEQEPHGSTTEEDGTTARRKKNVRLVQHGAVYTGSRDQKVSESLASVAKHSWPGLLEGPEVVGLAPHDPQFGQTWCRLQEHTAVRWRDLECFVSFSLSVHSLVFFERAN
jgi:hypothetical protein